MNTLAFERGIKESLRPVRGKSTASKLFHCTSRSLNHPPKLTSDHLMVLNILYDLIINNHFKTSEGGKIPRKWKIPEVYHQEAIFKGSTVDHNFNLFHYSPLPNSKTKVNSFQNLMETYKFLKEVPWDKRVSKSRVFANILRDLDNLIFNLSIKLRWVWTEQVSWTNNKGLKQFKEVPHCETLRFSNHWREASPLMRCPLIEEVMGSRGVENVNFQIDLGYPFSLMARQGLIFINIDWIPTEIYTTKNMTDGSRFLYITTFSGTRKNYNYYLEDLANLLSLNLRRSSNQLDYDIKNHLGCLIDNKFIKDIKYSGKRDYRRYEIFKK